MNEKIAQATPSNGASSANDFQPPTQNPQNIPGNVVQQQNSLQGVRNTQEFFNDTQNASIKVTSEPAPARAAVQPTNDAATFAVLMIVAAVIAFILLQISRRLKKKHSRNSPVNTVLQEDLEEPKPTTKKSTAKTVEASKPKKKTTTKKSGKKNKRQRR